MVVLLIYFFLFSFWLDKCVGFHLEEIFGLGDGFSLSNLALYFGLFVWLFTIKARKCLIYRNNLSNYLMILLVFSAVMIFPTFFNAGLRHLSVYEQIVYYKQQITPWVWFVLITTLVNDKKTCKNSFSPLILFLLATILSVLVQNFTGIDFGTQSLDRAYIGRSAGFSEANQFAAFLVLFFPLFLSLFLFHEKMAKRIQGFFFLGIIMVALLLTVSKGGFIAFFVSMAFFFCYALIKKMTNIVKVSVSILLFTSLAAASFFILPSNVEEKVVERTTLQEDKVDRLNPWAVKHDFETRLTSGRNLIWSYSFELIAEKPILGYGTNADKNLGFSTHSDPINWLLNYGIIGLFLFSLVYISIFRNVLRYFKMTNNSQDKMLYLGYISGFIGFSVAMFGVTMNEPQYLFWIYTALIYKHAHLEAVNQEETTSSFPVASSLIE